MNVTVVGSGVFGFSIALNTLKNGYSTTLLCSNKEKEDKLKSEKLEIIKGISIPNDMIITSDYEKGILNADVIFIMTSAKYLDVTLKRINKYANNKQVYCIGSKGIDQNSKKFVHEIFKDNMGNKHYSVLSGPSFAVDLAAYEPIGFSLASNDALTDKVIKNVLSSKTIKIRTSKDMVGLEICGSIKNVIALAAGIIDGLGYHESTRSFLLVESMHDIKNLIKSLNGRKKTILSYGGIGDLILTCTSVKSRNYTYGYLIGKKDIKGANEYLENNTVEGYYTLKSIYDLIKTKKIKMPIIDLIYKIIINNDDPNILINFLISKE